MLGKFRRAPKVMTFPIAVILHLSLIFFACVLAFAALLQPILLLSGRHAGGPSEAAVNFAGLIIGSGLLVAIDRLVAKVAVWLQR